MSKRRNSTEPVVEHSDSSASRGPQFSGDTEGGTGDFQAPLKKPSQMDYIMKGHVLLPIPLPNGTNLHSSSSRSMLNINDSGTESRFMPNPFKPHVLHFVQSSTSSAVDKDLLLPGSSPISAERFPASNISRYQGKSSYLPNHLWKSSAIGYVKSPGSAHSSLNSALAAYEADEITLYVCDRILLFWTLKTRLIPTTLDKFLLLGFSPISLSQNSLSLAERFHIILDWIYFFACQQQGKLPL